MFLLGKTLAYLLPITEALWNRHGGASSDGSIALILTPTRELAAQVAAIATVLAPPGTVRLVSRPMNLMARIRQEQPTQSDAAVATTNVQARIYVGAAQAIQHSLYGDGKMPAPPTSKPEAMWILQNTAYLVLDEVDKLLGVVGGNSGQKSGNAFGRDKMLKRNKNTSIRSDDSNKDNEVARVELPAAILTAAATRLTLGKTVVVAASATVGRALRRELARCMGLTPQECPPTLHEDTVGKDVVLNNDNGTSKAGVSSADTPNEKESNVKKDPNTMVADPSPNTSRAVTIPDSVKHYYVPVSDGTSPGKILTYAYNVIQELSPTHPRILLVLSRSFGISTANTIGALKHFRCQPEPMSLVEALEAPGTQAMMEVHQKVTRVNGVGGSGITSSEIMPVDGYLFVTGEDSIRGLHLDNLDLVLVAGRPVGPDEYTHIAGRTGRAGRSGSVVNILSDVDASKLAAWEKMLGVSYTRCDSPKSTRDLVKHTGPS